MKEKVRNGRALLWTGMVLLGMLLPRKIAAQQFAFSTNAIEYFNLCTFNAEASFAFSKNWTMDANFRYNPFHFVGKRGTQGFQSKVRAFSAGVRFWPWHIYSGWWFSMKAQYQEYSRGGFVSKAVREGDRVGGCFGLGYSYMLGKHFNLDFGLRVWSGMDSYRTYDCLVCGLTHGQGKDIFFLPDELILSITYVF